MAFNSKQAAFVYEVPRYSVVYTTEMQLGPACSHHDVLCRPRNLSWAGYRRQANCGSGISKLGPCTFPASYPNLTSSAAVDRFDDIPFSSSFCAIGIFTAAQIEPTFTLPRITTNDSTLLPIHNSHVVLRQNNALQPPALAVAGCDRSSQSHLRNHSHQEPDPIAPKGGLERAGHAHRTLL